jgi:transcriptional regulator with XRE-family HTH domain
MLTMSQIEAARVRARLKQVELCREAGINQHTYSRAKKPGTNTTTKTLEKLTSALKKLAGRELDRAA